MSPIPNETWRSLHRSQLRRRCLLLMASLGEAHVGQLARMLGIPHRRVLALLHGAPPAYRRELGLVALGLVEPKPTSTGRAYKITTRGLRKARSMTAARARRARAEGRTDAPKDAPTPSSDSRGAAPWGSFTWTIRADDRAPAGTNTDR